MAWADFVAYPETKAMREPARGMSKSGDSHVFFCIRKPATDHAGETKQHRMIHIGHLIETELRRQERSVSWFARKLCCERTNVYSIFRRRSVDTDLLLRISQILKHDFFTVYREEINRQP